MRRVLVMSALILGTACGGSGAPAESERSHTGDTPAAESTRPGAAAQRVQGVQQGMSSSEVEQLLGPPDDVLTPDDHPGTWREDTSLVWSYGTHGHGSFATEASVYFGQDGLVAHVYDGQGNELPGDGP